MKYTRNEVKFSLWLRAGIAGAAVFVIGSAQLVSGEVSPVCAFALAAVGAALVGLAWRARHLLDAVGDAAAAEAAASPARAGGRRRSLLPTATML